LRVVGWQKFALNYMVDAKPIAGLSFVKGDPISLERVRVFVLEFWATWWAVTRTPAPLAGNQHWKSFAPL